MIEKREAFWSELSGCVEERKRGCCHVVVLGDLNARVGNEEVLYVMGCREGRSVKRGC